MMRTTSAAITLALLVACGGEPAPAPTSPSPQLVRPASTGAIAILEPAPGQEIEGPDVRIRVELTGATLVEEVSTDLAPDEGHIHLSLDGEVVTLLGTLDEVIPDVAPGEHLLEVEFVAADHGPFNPRVLQAVPFTVT